MKVIVETDRRARIVSASRGVLLAISQTTPGRRRWEGNDLLVELSVENLRFLNASYPYAEWSHPEVLEKIIVRAVPDEPPPENDTFLYKTTPFQHQKKVFLKSRNRKVYGLFMEMGTGKTKVAIDTSAYLYSKGEIDCHLITAPNGVHRQWINEQVPTHLPDWVPRWTFVYKSGMSEKQLAEFYRGLEEHGGDYLVVVAMHVDAFNTEQGVGFARSILTRRKVLWSLDESTRIKSPKAQRTKKILELAPLAPYRRIMSGAPITQGVEDLYSQINFLSPDILGFKSYFLFRNYFCLTRPIPRAAFGAVKVVGYQRMDELQRILDEHSFRVTKDECLDLPKKIYLSYEVELTPEQKRLYKEMKEDLITQLDDGTLVSAPIAIVALTKLQQIICGHVKPEKDQPYVRVKSNRATVCRELVELAPGKVIVWCRYVADADILIEEFQTKEIGFVEYTGRIDNDGRTEAIRKFREDPDCKVFLASPQAGGTGLNLTVASTAIYYSNDFNADTRWQSEDRIHRIGQDQSTVYIDLAAPGTIDGQIIRALKAKKNVADNVLDVKNMLTEIKK